MYQFVPHSHLLCFALDLSGPYHSGNAITNTVGLPRASRWYHLWLSSSISLFTWFSIPQLQANSREHWEQWFEIVIIWIAQQIIPPSTR
jgi:hypothetical protein